MRFVSPTLLIPGPAQRYGNYASAVAYAGGQTVFSTDSASLKTCDGLLLPGGGDLEPWRYGQENTASFGLEPTRDTLELALLEQFLDAGKPVFGICRGLQAINVFFGGTLHQDLPGHNAAAGIDRLHRVTAAPSLLSTLYGTTHLVNSAHHQAVDRLGRGLRAIQWAPDGTVEALFHEHLPVFAVQWHPERLCGSLATPGAVDGRRLFLAILKQFESLK